MSICLNKQHADDVTYLHAAEAPVECVWAASLTPRSWSNPQKKRSERENAHKGWKA